MSTDSVRPHDEHGNKHTTLRKIHRSDTRPQTATSTSGAGAGGRRQGETKPGPGKGVESGKSEQRPAKRSHTTEEIILPIAYPSATSEEHDDPQPSAPELTSRKLPPTGDPAQYHDGRGESIRTNLHTVAQRPAGAAAPNRFDNASQGLCQTHPATTRIVTTPSRRGSRASNNLKTDDSRSETTLVSDVQQAVVEPDKVNDQIAATSVSEDPTKPPQGADQHEDSPMHSDSETYETPPNQDVVPGLQVATTTGMFGGIATALGIRPATVKEAKLERDNHRLKEDNKLLRMEFHSADSAARKYYREASRVHHENHRLQETLEAMSLELKGVTKRYEEAKALSETRGKELVGAQVFLTKADALSISELIQKVDGLNDEIYQAAASLSETIVQKKVEPSAEPAPSSSEENLTTAKALLGSPLCKVLRSRARKPDEGISPLLVQITLQAFFVSFCTQRIRSWTPSNITFDNMLSEIYGKIWSSSDQAVSGRWRSLTRAQMKPVTKEWITELTTGLDAILAVASWEISTPKDKHTLEARLPAIFKVVLDVREAIGEKFTSADIEVGCIEPLTPFNDVCMEETYGAGSEVHEKEPEIVIATVGMGLHKVVSLHGSRAYEYGLASKVVLESSLKKALEPPPPRTTTRSRPSRR